MFRHLVNAEGCVQIFHVALMQSIAMCEDSIDVTRRQFNILQSHEWLMCVVKLYNKSETDQISPDGQIIAPDYQTNLLYHICLFCGVHEHPIKL